MYPDQTPPPALTEYEGTVPILFRRTNSLLVAPTTRDQSKYLDVQLRAVRSEAATRWRKVVGGQAKKDEACCLEGVRGCSLKQNEREYGAGKIEDERAVPTSPSAVNLVNENWKASGLGQYGQLIQMLDTTSDWRTGSHVLEPWLDRYQRKGMSLKERRLLDRLATDFHPLRKTTGYTSLVSILNSELMSSQVSSDVFEDLEKEVTAEEKETLRAVNEDECNQHQKSTQEDSTDKHVKQPSQQHYSGSDEEQSSFHDIFTGQEGNGYTFSTRLSDGASSVIFLVEKEGGTFIAKVSKRPYSKNDTRFKIMKHEYKVMKKLKHPNIVKVYEYFVHRQHGVIIMEYMERGELWTYVDNNWPIPPADLQLILYEIMKAVRHIQKKGYTHMDIKTNNILMDRDGHVKLADFGGAKRYGLFFKNYRFNFFTPEFAPPEKNREEEYDRRFFILHKHFDIWSVGVVFYQLYTGRLPFTLADGCSFLPSSIFTEPVDFPEGAASNTHLLTLIRRCLQIEPSERISPKDALLHAYFYTSARE